MTIFGRPILGAVLATAAVTFPFDAQRATALTPAGELASHRAIYELKLAQTRGNSPAAAARGRILYDFSGNACDGYALHFRQVSELDNGEGKVTLSDLRSTTWEDGAAKKFIFKSQNYLNETLVDTVDGEAEREPDKVAVSLTQPAAKKFDLEAAMVFPTDHMRRIIEAAREDKNILELPVYDGSEKGEKVYDTVSVIGRPKIPGTGPQLPPIKNAEALEQLTAWPVSIAYFEPGSDKKDAVPVYELSFLFFENGVSRRLFIDYGEFAIQGEIKEIVFLPASKCDQR